MTKAKHNNHRLFTAAFATGALFISFFLTAPVAAATGENTKALSKSLQWGEVEGNVSLSGYLWFDEYFYRNVIRDGRTIEVVTEENGQIQRADAHRKVGNPVGMVGLSTNFLDKNAFTQNLNFNLNGNVYRTLNNANLETGGPGTRYLIQSASADYTELYRKRWTVTAGRVNLGSVGQTAVDGLQGQWNFDKDSAVGTFAGLMPEPVEQKFNTDYRTAGVFVVKQFKPGARLSTIAASVAGQTYQSQLYRGIFFFNLHSNLTSWLTFYEYLLMDLYDKKATTLRPTLSTSALYFHPGQNYHATLSFSYYRPQPELTSLSLFTPPTDATQKELIGVLPDSSKFYRVNLYQSYRLLNHSFPFARLSYRYHERGVMPPAYAENYPKVATNPHQLYGQAGWRQERLFGPNLKASVAGGVLNQARIRTYDVLLSLGVRYLRHAETTISPRVFFVKRKGLYSNKYPSITEQETSLRFDLETRYELTDKHEFAFDYLLFFDRENINNRYSWNHTILTRYIMRF